MPRVRLQALPGDIHQALQRGPVGTSPGVPALREAHHDLGASDWMTDCKITDIALVAGSSDNLRSSDPAEEGIHRGCHRRCLVSGVRVR